MKSEPRSWRLVIANAVAGPRRSETSVADLVEAHLDLAALDALIERRRPRDPRPHQRRHGDPRPAAVLEGLPAGFPPVRAANPAAIEQSPGLDGVRDGAAFVSSGAGGRGRRPFDDLRAALHRAAACRCSPSAARRCPTPSWRPRRPCPPTSWPGLRLLAQGGLANLDHLLRFVADRLLGARSASSRPRTSRRGRVWGEPVLDPARPTVGVVFYRATSCRGTPSSSTTCARRSGEGRQHAAVWCYSLRPDERGAGPRSRRCRARRRRRDHHRARDGRRRRGRVGGAALAALDVPVLQAIASTPSRRRMGGVGRGLTPLDVALSVAIPEFDGRIIAPAVLVQGGGRRRRRARHRRRAPTARCPTGSPASPGIAVRLARLAPDPDRREARRRSCSPPTRPSAAASATPSGSTRRRSVIELPARAARGRATGSTASRPTATR